MKNIIVSVFVLSLLICMSPVASAKEPVGTALGMGYYASIGAKKDQLNVFMYAPKSWELRAPIDDGISFTRTFPGVDVQGSIDVRMVDTSTIDRSVFDARGKSKAWIVKNYVPKTVFGSQVVTDITKSRVVIDGVVGMYYEYTFDTSRYARIVFAKHGNVYAIHAQTPTSEWKEHKPNLMNSLGTVRIAPLGLVRK